MEEWRKITDYEELYEVSNYGRVRKSVTNKVLKPGIINKYYSVSLTKIGKARHIKVHRLVAQAFIPNPLRLPQINHKDGDKLNNGLENLEWVTREQNLEHSWDMGLGPAPKRVIQYKDGIEVGRFRSTTEAGKVVGVTGSSIKWACGSPKRKSKGYSWKYAN